MDALVGALAYRSQRVATGSMGFKLAAHLRAGALLHHQHRFHGAWAGPAALELHSHALAPVADLPVRKVLSALHFVVDLTLELGEVVNDYLPDRR